MYKLLYLVPDTCVIIQFLDEDATAVVPIRRLKEREHGAHVLLHGVIIILLTTYVLSVVILHPSRLTVVSHAAK